MECHENHRGRTGYALTVSAIFLTLLVACGGDDLLTARSLPDAPVSSGAPTSSNDDPHVPNAQIQGTYDVTFTTSSDCTLPVEVRTRSYVATVIQTPSSPSDVVKVVLSGANFWPHPTRGVLNHFGGSVLDDGVALAIGDYGIAEEIGPGILLAIHGTASGSAGGSSITANLRGGFSYGEDPWGENNPWGHVGCSGGSVTFTRQ